MTRSRVWRFSLLPYERLPAQHKIVSDKLVEVTRIKTLITRKQDTSKCSMVVTLIVTISGTFLLLIMEGTVTRIITVSRFDLFTGASADVACGPILRCPNIISGIASALTEDNRQFDYCCHRPGHLDEYSCCDWKDYAVNFVGLDHKRYCWLDLQKCRVTEVYVLESVFGIPDFAVIKGILTARNSMLPLLHPVLTERKICQKLEFPGSIPQIQMR